MVLSNFPKPSKAKYSHCIGIITELDAASALRVSNPNDGAQSMMIKSYSSRIGTSTFFNRYSLSSKLTKSSSAPTKSILAGSKSRLGLLVSTIHSLAVVFPVKHSYIPFSISFVLYPTPELALAWGSASIKSTFFSSTPKHPAKFMAVVVFPTPPF